MNAPARTKFSDCDDLCRYIADTYGDTCIISFSCGKDAIASWVQCRKFFRTIKAYYMEVVPGLEFVESSLRYYEDFFGTEIIRVPNPNLWRMLGNLMYQPPERCARIEQADLPTYDRQELNGIIRRQLGLAEHTPVAVGTRMADSPIRRIAILRHGPVSHRQHTFMPVYDWRIDRLASELEGAGVKLPIDYEMFGRTFDGLFHQYLKPIKDRFPRDYQRILDWFPLADLELMRYEMMENIR